MKSSRNIMRRLGFSYSLSFIPVILLNTVIILAFASGHGSNIHSGNDVYPLQQGNYSVIIDNADHDINVNLKVNLQNKNSIHFDSITALKKPLIPKTHCAMPDLYIDISKEKSMEIESWMLECKYFGQPINCFKEELEKPLEIEDWMVNSRYFGSSSETFHEEDLQIESWMISDHFWGY